MNRTTWTLAALVGLALAPGGAAARTFPTDDPVIQAMWEQGMGSGSQVFDLAQALVDSIGPRLMGSPAYEDAAGRLMDRYRSWGIETERQEYGTWIDWERGYTHIDFVSPRVRTLSGTMLAWSPGTEGPVEADVPRTPSQLELIPGALRAVFTECAG